MKNNIIAFSIILSSFIVGGYIYDMHKFDELLRIKNMQKSQLLLYTKYLELHLSIKSSLEEGNTQEVSDTIDVLISGMSQYIKSEMPNVELSVKQKKRVNNALNGKITPCNEI